MIYLVTLQRSPFRDMQAFTKAIEQNSESWWRMHLNVWLVDTKLSAEALFDALVAHIDPNTDRMLVMEANPDMYGQLDEPAWEWIETSYENGDFDSPRMAQAPIA